VIPSLSVSITRLNFLALVAILQLLLASSLGPVLAQNLNLQQQLNQLSPLPQTQQPDLSVGRRTPPSSGQTEHARHNYRQHKKPPSNATE
jgi:hypothetical protein